MSTVSPSMYGSRAHSSCQTRMRARCDRVLGMTGIAFRESRWFASSSWCTRNLADTHTHTHRERERETAAPRAPGGLALEGERGGGGGLRMAGQARVKPVGDGRFGKAVGEQGGSGYKPLEPPLEGVAAPRPHCGPTLVVNHRHPKMHPPKRPQKSFVASTPPVFPRFFLHGCQ